MVYYVGGADAVLREARPILEASSKEIIHIGEIGQASAIKIATNMITAASVQATAEALALVQALGVPLEKFVEAIRVNSSHSGTLAMKLPKMLDRDFEAQFSVKHMLKDMQIANQIALSHYLDLGVTSAARDQLFEQMQWGHGDNDYSVVARKYLQEVGPASHEEPQPEHPDQESIANEPIIASPESHTEQSKPEDPAAPSSQQPLLAFTGTGGATANETTRLRRGFFKQLLSRLSSGQ